jgi:hypothetical protein
MQRRTAAFLANFQSLRFVPKDASKRDVINLMGLASIKKTESIAQSKSALTTAITLISIDFQMGIASLFTT